MRSSASRRRGRCSCRRTPISCRRSRPRSSASRTSAYATWLVQLAFRRWAPAHFDWYLAAAVPASFIAAALVGALLELTVVRKLYGRPLETLLATFGASLLLIQGVRSVFGAQNVEVANPDWMSGGITVLAGLVLPFNRIAILLFGSF